MFKKNVNPLSEGMTAAIAKSINKLQYVEEKASRPADSAEGDVKAQDITGEEPVKTDGSATKAPARKGDQSDAEPMQKVKEEVELDEAVNVKAIQKAVDDGKSMDAIMTMFANKRTTNTDEIRKVVKDYMWKKRMKKEEVEDLDELSKKTLGSYVKKAADSLGKSSSRGGYEFGSGDMKAADKEYDTADKRNKGIKRATDRLTKEEVELDEANINDMNVSAEMKSLLQMRNIVSSGSKSPRLASIMKEKQDLSKEIGKVISQLKRKEEGKSSKYDVMLPNLVKQYNDVAEKMYKLGGGKFPYQAPSDFTDGRKNVKEEVEITELHMSLLEAHGIEKKMAEKIKKVFDAMSTADKAAFMKAYLKNPKAANEYMADQIMKGIKAAGGMNLGEAMDPVDAKALKGKHSERKDKDIDNDGDVDSSDEYLHKRRKAISKALKKEEADTSAEKKLEEKAPKIKGDWLKKERERNRAHDSAMGRTATGRKKPERAMTSTQRSLASMRKEEVEQIDEARWEYKGDKTYMVGGNLRYDDKIEYKLSKANADILNNYMKQAKSDAERSKVWTMFWDSKETGDKATGPEKAIAFAKKAIKEEVELDENDSKDKYRKASYIDMVVSQIPQKDVKKLEAEMNKHSLQDLKAKGAKYWKDLAIRMRNEEVELDEAIEVKSGRNKGKWRHSYSKSGEVWDTEAAADAAYKKQVEKNKNTKVKLKDLEPRKSVGEEVELDEAYTINHKTFSAAVQHAKAQVEKQGYTIDDDEWDRKVAMGPKKPGTGKTNRYTIDLMKGGKETRRKLQMQVYYDEGRYELNMYIS